jgi:hypothetical protein
MPALASPSWLQPSSSSVPAWWKRDRPCSRAPGLKHRRNISVDEFSPGATKRLIRSTSRHRTKPRAQHAPTTSCRPEGSAAGTRPFHPTPKTRPASPCESDRVRRPLPRCSTRALASLAPPAFRSEASYDSIPSESAGRTRPNCGRPRSRLRHRPGEGAAREGTQKVVGSVVRVAHAPEAPPAPPALHFTASTASTPTVSSGNR